MSELLQLLNPKERRGSKPRCHWLTHGGRAEVAARLSALAAPWANVSPTDRWMPQGFESRGEAQLHRAPELLGADLCTRLAEWWLPPGRHAARTPNFDVASTCKIEGRDGLMLVEAKAHDEELMKESAGKKLAADASPGSRASHATIEKAIRLARDGLRAATSLPWEISRDSHYQMANRFAWAWKVAERGMPIVLIYLGFLNAREMTDKGQPFVDHDAWESLVRAHSGSLFPGAIWNRRWSLSSVPFVPLIRSLERPFDAAAA